MEENHRRLPQVNDPTLLGREPRESLSSSSIGSYKSTIQCFKQENHRNLSLTFGRLPQVQDPRHSTKVPLKPPSSPPKGLHKVHIPKLYFKLHPCPLTTTSASLEQKVNSSSSRPARFFETARSEPKHNGIISSRETVST